MRKFSGSVLCDHCRTILVAGGHQLKPFTVVDLKTADDGPAPHEAHFDNLNCLCAEVDRIVQAFDSGETTEDTAEGLCRLVQAQMRWVSPGISTLKVTDASRGLAYAAGYAEAARRALEAVDASSDLFQEDDPESCEVRNALEAVSVKITRL